MWLSVVATISVFFVFFQFGLKGKLGFRLSSHKLASNLLRPSWLPPPRL
jgi:hypothetical protein